MAAPHSSPPQIARHITRSAALTLALAAVAAARAASYAWNKTPGAGPYSGTTNWTPTSPTGGPQSTDTANFSATGAYTVQYDVSPTNAAANFTLGNVTLQALSAARTYNVLGSTTISGSNVTLSGTADSLLFTTAGSFFLQLGSTLTISQGNSVTAGAFIIGGSGAGIAVIDGTGSNLTASQTTVGQVANCSVTFQNAATGSLGILGVSNAGNASTTGAVTLQSGASVTATSITLGGGAGAQGAGGTLTIGNATLTQMPSFSTTIGSTSLGTFTMNINNLGVFNGAAGLMLINKTGAVTVASGGTLDQNGGVTVVGGKLDASAGTFNWAAGQTMSIQASGSGGVVLAPNTYSTPTGATIAITGSGSKLQGSSLSIGSGAQVTVGVGAALVGTTLLNIGNGGNGAVTVDGGQLTAGGSSTWGGQTGAGTIVLKNAATASVAGIGMASGSTTGAAATVTLQSGAVLTNSGNLDMATGNPANVATLTVTDASSSWTQTGSGTMTIGAAGAPAGSVAIHVLNAATFATGTGMVSMAGSGKIDLNGGTFNLGGSMTLSGGSFQFSSGAFNWTDGNTLTISNGAAFNFGAQPFLSPPTATVVVQDGGTMTAGDVILSASGSGTHTGTFSVIGAGSTVTQLSGSALTIGGSASLFAAIGIDSGGAFFQGSNAINTFVTAALGTGTTTLNPSGAIQVTNSGVLRLGTVVRNSGIINLDATAIFGFVGDLSVSSAGLFGGSISIGPGGSRALSGATTINAGCVLALQGGEFSTGTLINNGTLTFNAGTLALTDQNFTIGAGGLLGSAFQLSGYPGDSTNAAGPRKLIIQKGLAAYTTGGLMTINPASQLFIGAGGTLQVDTFTDNGFVSVALYAGTSAPATLTVNNGGAVGSSATLAVQQNQFASLNGAFTNAGTISLGTTAGDAGYILGTGALSTSGAITGNGEIAKPLATTAASRISALDSLGATLRITGGAMTNSGQVLLNHGTIEFAQSLTNALGATIIGAGNLTADAGIINNGQIQFAPGNSVVNGAISSGSGSKIIVGAGASVAFYSPLTLNNSTFQVAPSATAVFFGPVTGNGGFTGTGTIDFESGHSPLAGGILAPLSMDVEASATVDAASLQISSLYLGGTVNITPNGTSAAASVIGALTPAGGTLNLANNDLVIHNSTLPAVLPLVQTGYANGTWNGPGITASSAASNPGQALGILSGAAYLAFHPGALFDGFFVASTDILVKYTYQGDATLDGTITIADYAQIDTAFLLGGFNAGNPASWINGDFNYDGVVNYKDYALIDFAFEHQSGGPLSAEMIATHAAEFGQPYLDALTALTHPTPEPATLTLLALGLITLSMRRR